MFDAIINYGGMMLSMFGGWLIYQAIKWLVANFGGTKSTDSDAIGTKERQALIAEAKAYAHDWRLHIVACTAKFANIDGVVTKSELAVVEEVFESLELTGALRPLAIHTFGDAKTGLIAFRDCVQSYLESYQNELDLLQILMCILFAIALADGEPNAQTRRALLEVCRSMDLDYQQCADASKRRKANAKSSPLEAACTVLGCKSTDTAEFIRDRYRKLVKDFHPDTVISKGLPAELVTFAEERFKQIQAAYERVMEARTAGKV